jgi:hypothetical protein
MWDVLGVKPALGRVFTPEEDQDGNGAKVAILNHRFWQRRFGGSASVLGQTMMVDGDETTIIGVMPQDFEFFSDETAFWTPMGFSPQQLNSAASFLIVAGRLNDGLGRAQAQAEMDAIAAGLRQSFPDRNKDRGVFVEPIQTALTQGPREPLMILQGAVVFVLLIACSNVASLLLGPRVSQANGSCSADGVRRRPTPCHPAVADREPDARSCGRRIRLSAWVGGTADDPRCCTPRGPSL